MVSINSTFLEDNLEFINEHLDCHPANEIITKNIKKHKEGHYTAESFLKISKHISIIDTNFNLKKMITDKFSVWGDFVMISCVFKGESRLSEQAGKNLELGQVFLSYFTRSSEVIKMPTSRTRYVCILVNSNFYLQLLKNERWIKDDSFYHKVKANSFISLGELSVPLGFHLQQITKEMIDCNWKHKHQLDYLELKLKELFLHLYYQNEEQYRQNDYKISKNSLEKLKNARAYLMSNYKDPPTVKVLSKTILLNEAELKKGFKEIYGITIRAYIIELRMKKASSLIKNHSVNEVAGNLGYKSVPHFINTFKKYYGVTPKQLF